MDELNLYALLRRAREVATASAADIFGVEVGLVTNVQDPEKQGRVKVCLPRLPGRPESEWARVVQPAAGDGRGLYWIPQINDEVLLAYERGQANRPFVIVFALPAKVSGTLAAVAICAAESQPLQAVIGESR